MTGPVYVYGIVPAAVEAGADARGVGDPPGGVTTVRHGDIAALVSPLDPGQPLGRPHDLAAHAEVLDGAAADAPVLPLRFGAVLAGVDQVAEELLAANQDDFAAALRELQGKAEFLVRGRYRERAVLREILDEHEDLARLRVDVRDRPEDVTRDQRIALGEGVTTALAAKREADTGRVASALRELDLQVVVREPTHEQDAVHVACLVDTAKRSELRDAVARLAREWDGRVDLRLLGPVAAYDFVVTDAAARA
ncbi:MAG: GvpL/GvpF family gas vesicle protein [Saccharothrix sp.]|nr:GvpL/GvpF family gas vesicle protein [Saccharothrix sp.]